MAGRRKKPVPADAPLSAAGVGHGNDYRLEGMKRRLIEHYEVVRKLGAGGSGVVYLANDTLLMRPVVLKILKRGALSIEQMRSTVLREARAGLRHRTPQRLRYL